MNRIVAAITGTRSDWGIMAPVYTALHRRGLYLHCLETGMLLLPRFAEDSQRVHDAFPGKVHVIATQDAQTDNVSMAAALGRAIIGMASCLHDITPDILLLQGDRGEMLAGALAAAHLNIPIVHMSGGDRSGTIDDSIRHAISSMAHIHLPTCATSAEELLRRGELPGRICTVGEPGLDTIAQTPVLSRAELWEALGLNLDNDVLLVAQHPVTTESSTAAAQIRATLEAACAEARAHHLSVVATAANSDAGGEDMNTVLAEWAGTASVRVFDTLGALLFLNLLRHARVLVGNSSSGIWEAPSFGLPVVNIGTRQHGRLRAANVLDVPEYETAAIRQGIRTALTDAAFQCAAQQCTNPYGDGKSAERAANIVARLKLDDAALVAKWLDTGRDYLDFAR